MSYASKISEGLMMGIALLEIWLFGIVCWRNYRIVVYFVDMVWFREIDFVLCDCFARVWGWFLQGSTTNCARLFVKQFLGAEQLRTGMKRSE